MCLSAILFSVLILQFYTRCHSGIAEVRTLRERFVNTCRTLQHAQPGLLVSALGTPLDSSLVRCRAVPVLGAPVLRVDGESVRRGLGRARRAHAHRAGRGRRRPHHGLPVRKHVTLPYTCCSGTQRTARIFSPKPTSVFLFSVAGISMCLSCEDPQVLGYHMRIQLCYKLLLLVSFPD